MSQHVRRPSAIALAALLLAAAGTPSALAQAPLRGEIAVAFDPLGTVASLGADQFDRFHVYVVSIGIGEIAAWESSFERPGGFTTLSTTYSEPGAIDIGSGTNYAVGLGTCADYPGRVALMDVEGGFFGAPAPTDALFCLGPTSPSSVTPEAPAFVDCARQLFRFAYANVGVGGYPDQCAVLNPTREPPIPAEAHSFGAWKGAARAN